MNPFSVLPRPIQQPLAAIVHTVNEGMIPPERACRALAQAIQRARLPHREFVILEGIAFRVTEREENRPEGSPINVERETMEILEDLTELIEGLADALEDSMSGY